MNFSTPVAHIVFCLPFIANVSYSPHKKLFIYLLVYLKNFPRLLNVYQESKKGMDEYIYVALKNINISDIKILIRSCY